MEITIQPQTQWKFKPGVIDIAAWNRWLAVLDSQEKSKTLWYIVSLVAQGVLFLPVPAALIYYFDAPLLLLPITLGLYFANIIAGMGGAGIRVTVSLFLVSVFAHLAMLAFYIL